MQAYIAYLCEFQRNFESVFLAKLSPIKIIDQKIVYIYLNDFSKIIFRHGFYLALTRRSSFDVERQLALNMKKSFHILAY